jgi:acetyl esterase
MAAIIQPFPNVTPAERAELLRIGPIWGNDLATHRETVFSVYDPLLAKSAKPATVERDIKFGDDPRQVLDVFAPTGPKHGGVFAFVHGGAFVRGSKCTTPEIYDNVLWYFARHGYIGVNIEYRNGDVAPYPGGSVDIGAAIAWIKANIGRFGGDPQQIHLSGHSAGATHIATYALDPVVRPAGGPGIASLILLSGRLRVDAHPDNPNADPVKIYYGADASLYDKRSCVSYAENCDMPVFIGIAEYENPYLDLYGLEFAHRIAVKRKRAPRLVRLMHHNHISLIAHLGTAEDVLGREIRDFMALGR